jgi:hypothetical protein
MKEAQGRDVCDNQDISTEFWQRDRQERRGAEKNETEVCDAPAAVVDRAPT